MTDGQRALDDALKRCDFLKKLLRKRTAKQVGADDERQTIKATSFAWFNNQKPLIVSQIEPAAIAPIDKIYNELLSASDRAGSRSRYLENLKTLRKELLSLRAKLMLAPAIPRTTTDVPPSFAKLVPDPKMQAILTRRWNECVTCLNAPAPMAATVMMGGLLEGLLLARSNKEVQSRLFTAVSAPKEKGTTKTKPLKEWMLKNFIDVGHELKWITTSAKDVSSVLGEYRNYIHPQKEHSHGIELKPEDAAIMWEVAKSISKQLL
ncbi:MAG TPA: hypothetical protein VFR24_01435 [Candidatus Angelobacter sp.]|nr:hypothetical protein [Candidatus Angelobacter sp.]